MPDALTARALQQLLDRLPHEHGDYDEITRRVRFTTSEGRTFFAFVRAGDGKLSFAGWEVKPGMSPEDDWEYFALGAEKPGDPLQVVGEKQSFGVVVAAELQDRDG